MMTSAAAYIVEVSPTNADRTNVTGTATLGGTLQAVFTPGAYISRSYIILSATGGSTGTFSSLTTSGLPAGFKASLSYTATDTILNLFAKLAVLPNDIGTGGLSINQRNVATALDNFFNNGGTLPPGFLPIFGLTGSNLGNALSQLSGEAATGGQQSIRSSMDARARLGAADPRSPLRPSAKTSGTTSRSPIPRCSRRRPRRHRTSSSVGPHGAAPMAARTARQAIRR